MIKALIKTPVNDSVSTKLIDYHHSNNDDFRPRFYFFVFINQVTGSVTIINTIELKRERKTLRTCLSTITNTTLDRLVLYNITFSTSRSKNKFKCMPLNNFGCV